MQARPLKWDHLRSVFGRIAAGLLPCAAALLGAPPAAAQVIPGNTGTVTVLAEGLATPTTVAVRGGVAFVPEGQFTRLGVLGGLFQARAISLEGAGILGDSNLRIVMPGNTRRAAAAFRYVATRGRERLRRCRQHAPGAGRPRSAVSHPSQ